MKTNYKNLIFAVSVVAVVVPSVLFVHNYIYYISHLEKIEFEQVTENCGPNCKLELEKKGFSCEAKGHIGYACVPPIDTQRIEQRRDYWDQLAPPSYGYLEVFYDDKDFGLGLLRDIEIIDENQIKATFRHNINDNYGTELTPPTHNYENIRIMKVGDTFIPKCHNQYIQVFKLYDIVVSEDASYVVFIYRVGISDVDRCVFPGILENSFNVKFDI